MCIEQQNSFSHYRIDDNNNNINWCFCILEISPKNKQHKTLSHSNFEPIVSIYIGEYLWLIISFIFYEYNSLVSHPRTASERKTSQLKMLNIRFIYNGIGARSTRNSSIKMKCDRVFGCLIFINRRRERKLYLI